MNGKGMKEVFEWILCFAVAIAVALFLKTFILTIAQVDGNSMCNTLHHNERLITWKLGYKPSNGDVIIFEPKESTKGNRKYFVKRVIATEHQTVEIDYIKNEVYVDGVKIDEPYINSEADCQTHMNDPMVAIGTETKFVVPEDCVFVMGDNRNHSRDSRDASVGYVPLKDVEGKVVFRFWPLNKMGIVK